MTKLPIIGTATESVGFGFGRAGTTLRLGWFSFLLFLVVYGYSLWLLFGSLIDLGGGWEAIMSGEFDEDVFDDMYTDPAMMAKLNLASLLPYLAMLFLVPVYTIITQIAADDREAPGGPMFFRFGLREILFAAAAIFWYILICIAFVVGIIPGVIMLVIGAVGAEGDGLGTVGLLSIPVFVIGLLAALWVYARLVPFLPAVAVEKDFALASAWTMGKGNGWRIFWSMVLMVIIMIALSLGAYLVFGLLGLIGYGIYEALGTGGVAVGLYAVLGLAGLVAIAWMSAVLFGIQVAFPALVYRNLKGNVTEGA